MTTDERLDRLEAAAHRLSGSAPEPPPYADGKHTREFDQASLASLESVTAQCGPCPKTEEHMSEIRARLMPAEDSEGDGPAGGASGVWSSKVCEEDR